ncbi:hypothetical protein BGAL_0191g00040 [Botrytis galanthina]|uniref:Uncharacterized protein n=1 Tax=Botrytis galanthina TaxID=278940 RepID=A0A4S8QW20_9HELO|nr:hypothetical protein BGAL_0191g00040 [Botrytis galanthina]
MSALWYEVSRYNDSTSQQLHAIALLQTLLHLQKGNRLELVHVDYMYKQIVYFACLPPTSASTFAPIPIC